MWLLALAMTAVPPTASEAPSAQVKAILQNCDAHKFETTIDVTVDGAVKKSHVKLCGMDGQTDADWLRTLKDAALKTQSNSKMPPAVRNQIVAALGLEILRLSSPGSLRKAPKSSALDGISELPPIPDGPQPSATAALPPPRVVIEPSIQSEAYSSLPPMPSAPPSPVHVLASEAMASVPLLSSPKISFSCVEPGEGAEGPCTDFDRDTLLTVQADEDLPAGTSLRFVRSGQRRADVELAQLKRGTSARFSLPQDVCRGVNGGKLEIRVVRASPAAGPDGQEVRSDGPFVLRC
jgi:hypothetical protein